MVLGIRFIFPRIPDIVWNGPIPNKTRSGSQCFGSHDALLGFKLNRGIRSSAWILLLNLLMSRQSGKSSRDLVEGIDNERGDKPKCSFDQEKRYSIPSKLFHPASFLGKIQKNFGFICAHCCLPFSGNEIKPPLRGKATQRVLFLRLSCRQCPCGLWFTHVVPSENTGNEHGYSLLIVFIRFPMESHQISFFPLNGH